MTGSIGPFDDDPDGFLPPALQRAELERALRGVRLGAYDERVLTRLSESDSGTVRAVVGLIERARLAGRKEHARESKPLRGANFADFLTLLALCRDALDAGHGDLCRAVLHLIVEHQGALGVRSRNLARRLAGQMAERDREREQPPE